MARIRSIHPSLFTDEAFMEASLPARLLLIGIWTEADDQGVFEWKPVTLKARLLPADMVDVASVLAELAGLGFVQQFEVGAKKYGAVKNFRRFQRPKKPNAVYDLPAHLADFVGLGEDEEGIVSELRRRKHAEQNGECAYCRTTISYYSKRSDSLEIDHVMPVCRGGTDDDENLVAACRNCNRSKGSRTGDEFREWLRSRISPKISDKSAKAELAPQMEDGGWRGEERNNISGGSTIRVHAAAAALPSAELERRLEQATGWASLRNIAAIGKLVAEGFSLEDRILPLARSISEDVRARNGEKPVSWAFIEKAVRDPSREAKPCAKEVEMAFLPVGGPHWQALLAAGKRESFLKDRVKRAGDGTEGIFWAVRDLPAIQSQSAA